MRDTWSENARARADLAICRARLRVGSKSFAGASALLPPPVRDAATALYAFCREADDTVDLLAGGSAAIDGLNERLDRIYIGDSLGEAVDRALQRVVQQYAIPRTLFDALLQGFEWDASGRRYETLAEVLQYAARVAGTIGAMMALFMGVRSREVVSVACDLGMAMQLTNIARDVGEDARAGRLYLPMNAMRYVGIDPDQWLRDPRMSAGLRVVIGDLLHEADYLYSGAESGIAALPRACQSGIMAARLIYADIGRVVRQAGCDSISRRAIVSRQRKCWLLAKSFYATPRANDSVIPLRPATRHLIESVDESAAVVTTAPAPLAWWRVRSRALWLIDLFERLHRRADGKTLHAANRELDVLTPS